MTNSTTPAEPATLSREKRAPVQGFSAGIPWSMHLRAYDAYSAKWSPQPALIDLEGRNCRGGFGVKELDEFIPGWRDELSEITALKKRIAELEAARPAPATAPADDVVEALRALRHMLACAEGLADSVAVDLSYNVKGRKRWLDPVTLGHFRALARLGNRHVG